MNTKQLNRILARAMYSMVIVAMAFSVTGTVYAQDEEPPPPPPRIYANLTDDSIRYELAEPYATVTFSIYDAPGGNLLWEEDRTADETGFTWISIWDHRQDLIPGTYIIVAVDDIPAKDLVVEQISIDSVDPDGNILRGTKPSGKSVWVVANNDPENCGVTVEADSSDVWEVIFNESCPITADMVFYAQVMDAEDDTSEANPDFIDGWHDGTEGIGHANSCDVSGFALDTNDRERYVQINILSDGEEVIHEPMFADLAWDDLRGVCGDDGSCGFYVNLWGLISNYEEHQITVQVYDQETEAWVDLGGTPRTLTCVNYDLYVLNVKTGGVERLTTLEDTGEYNPSWSNDGKKIVHDVADADSHKLYITDVKTHISTPLIGGEDGNDAVWSPNGKWIVFDRRWFDDSNLYILPPKGGTPQLVVENAVNGDWSPDSQRLVFERDGGIWTASVGGGAANQIVEGGYSPVWSPDGMWIAYDLDGDIWKIEVDEYGVRVGDPFQLTSGPVGEAGPTWSQNSDSIAFISNASGDYDVWKIPADGGMPVQLRGAIGFDEYDPTYSNNGQYIAYEAATEPSTPHIEADAWQDSYVLADWPTGQAINVSIDDPGTSKKPDYRTTFTPDGSTNGYFFQPGLNIEPGYVITAASKFFTKTLTVTELAATYIDVTNGIVRGVAPPYSEFYMVTDGDHFQVAIGENVTADENGEWNASPSEYAPWTWYTGGEMWQWDDDGDITHARWHVHQEVIEVWLRYNEIRAFDWPLDTTLTFYVDGVEIATSPTEPLTWMDGTWAVVNAGDLQLEPGMTVKVTDSDGTTTKELVIQDIRITNIDIENDIVYGYAPENADLELGSWEDSPVYRFFKSGTDGKWTVNYQEPSLNGVTVDLNPGDDLRLFLRDDEKDATVWEAYGPNTRFTVWPEWNYLEGYEWPDGAEISISVAGKEACSVEVVSSFPEGDPWNTFFSMNFPEGCDIEAGDEITISSEMLSLTHQVQELTITEVNIDDNTVAGTATFDPTQYFFHTWIDGIDGAYMELPAQSGDWLADFGSLRFDLQPGMSGRVELVDQASNATAVEWYIPNPRIVVQITDDWFRAENFTPNAELTFWVYESEGGELLLHPENTRQLDDSGYVTVGMWEFEENIDLVPGNYLVVSDGEITKELTLEDFTFDVFSTTNGQLSGTAPEPFGRPVWVVIGFENDAWTMDITTDETGAWSAEFGQPVPSGYQWVAAQIFDDDGDASELRPAKIIP